MTRERSVHAGAGDRRDRWKAWWTRFSRSHARTAAAALLCALGGAAYAHFVGCRTGSCPLTSSVWSASMYGAFVGSVLGWPARAP